MTYGCSSAMLPLSITVYFTTQARVNPEHYVNKCMGGAVCCSKSIKPTNHLSTLFIKMSGSES